MNMCHPAVERLLLTGDYCFLLSLILSGLWFHSYSPTWGSGLVPGARRPCCSYLAPVPPTLQWGNYTSTLQQETCTHIAPLDGIAGALPGSCGVRGAMCTLAFFWFIFPALGWSFAQHTEGQVGLSILQEAA